MWLMATLLDIAVLYYVGFLFVCLFVFITSVPWDEDDDLVKFGKTS